MVEITESSEIGIIQLIVDKTWVKTYQNILSREQIEYMLKMMYSYDSIKEQIEVLNHHFLLIKSKVSDPYQGFVSYELGYQNQPKSKIHKLYVLPECQGLGFGKLLIEEVASRAKAANNNVISLNVNRSNEALNFYKHIGFVISGEENIDIGNGYLMEDYVLEKVI